MPSHRTCSCWATRNHRRFRRLEAPKRTQKGSSGEAKMLSSGLWALSRRFMVAVALATARHLAGSRILPSYDCPMLAHLVRSLCVHWSLLITCIYEPSPCNTQPVGTRHHHRSLVSIKEFGHTRTPPKAHQSHQSTTAETALGLYRWSDSLGSLSGLWF